MKKKLMIALFFLAAITYGQQRTITGTVSDASGIPLPGVNIVIKGTATGTQSDFDGNYAIEADRGQVLVFSYIGQRTEEIAVGSSDVINLQMEEDAQALEEVVVTAQGISRQKKALGYAVTTVKSDQLESRPEADLGRVLNGKVAGVNIVGTGGLAGSGTNIIIRGNSSINQSNQPLFVVDGVPFNSGTNEQSGFGDGGESTSSRFLDIDPNNIESLSVLKGLSATVLYGEQGRNGVILITTKNGSSAPRNKKMEVSMTQSTFVNEIASLPDYQNTYGQGADNAENVGFVGNWGARFDRNITVPHHYNLGRLAEAFPEFQGVFVDYEPFRDNVKKFFRKGIATNTTVGLSKSSDKVSFNMSVGHTDEDGYLRGNNLKRFNISAGGTARLDNNFTLTTSINYTKTDFVSPPAGSDGVTGNLSVFERTLFVPRNFDLNGLPYQNPITGESVYYRTDQENPNWLIDNSQISQRVNRFFNATTLKYDFSDKFSAMYRLGYDTYTENQQYYINRGGVSNLQAQIGYLKNTSAVNSIIDHSLIFTLDNIDLTENLGLTSRVGINLNRETYNQFGVVSTGQVVFGFIDHNNFGTQSNVDPLGPATGLDFRTERNVMGVYGQVELDYNNYLYLTLAGRNDWASTVEMENRSLFYPSASLSFIPTTVFEGIKSDFLNYLKLRMGYGTSAGFPSPYLTRQTLVLQTAEFVNQSGNSLNTNSSASLFPNSNLKPELHREVELGIEANFWNNRINFEGSIYRRISEDQILSRLLDPSTGFNSTFINAGKIENKGLELTLGFSPFRNSKFQWNSNAIFTAYETTVKELPDNIDQIVYTGFSNIGNNAIEGEPLGVIVTSYALTDDDGNYLINPSTGNIIDNEDVGLPDRISGDPNPDWKVTSINSFSYKGLTLSGQLEYTHGGDFYSTTIGNLVRRGVTRDTDNREQTFTIPGVYANPNSGELLLDSSGNTIPNTIQMGGNELYFLNFLDPNGQIIYDGSLFRLREVSLTYALPGKLLEKTPFGSLSISFMGQNLWYYAPNIPRFTNFDPETISTGVGNGQGLDFQTAPSARKYGVSLKATF